LLELYLLYSFGKITFKNYFIFLTYFENIH
jgi:hypothetical protein